MKGVGFSVLCFVASTVSVGPSCNSSAGAAGDGTYTLSCPRSLDAYCAQAVPPCVRHVDLSVAPDDFLGAFCTAPESSASVAFLPCGSSPTVQASDLVDGVSFERSYVYDRQGTLTAVIDRFDDSGAELSTCVGGPPMLVASACLDAVVAFGCAGLDAGVTDANLDGARE